MSSSLSTSKKKSYPELAKSSLLFGFKINAILSANNNILWKPNKPNSQYSTRPVALLAIPENEDNVKFLMDSLINQETLAIEESGLSLHNGHAEVKIIRSHFDTKMAKILSGAGGASCQLCTASFAQRHDNSFVKTGNPMNRTIHDALALFEEVDEDEFLSLQSNQRFNLTHKPISDKDIGSASPLHAYLRTFSWSLLLVSHLQCGAKKWSPTSSKIVSVKRFITNLIEEKINISIDAPSVQGGTSTTGNVVRRCFTRKDDTVQDFLYWVLTVIPQENHQKIPKIFNNLGAILRLYNSNRKIDTEGLDNVCRETYESILINFSWAHVTPNIT